MKSAQYEYECAEERSQHLEENAVRRFAREMCAKLRLNARKPHWASTPTTYLIQRLEDEVAELDAALVNTDDPYFQEKVVTECADVANIVMMISDNIRPVRGEAPDPVKDERERICALLLDQAQGLRESAGRNFYGHPGLQNAQRIKAQALSDVVYDIRETAVGGRFG